MTTKRKPPDLAGAARPGAAAAPTESPRPKGTASRAAKRGILVYVEPEMGRKLKILAAERDTSLQAIGLAAFEQLLADNSR